jgi:catechol 2,3-dioxygenase-like lactoylglutathione lyase family enzyme
MLNAVRNRMIGLAFDARAWSVRARRALTNLGQPALGAIDHVTLPVRDLALARHFYCDVLGACHLMTLDAEALARFGRPPAPNDGDGAYHVSLVLGGSTRLDLFLQQAGQPPLTQGHPHLAFRVAPGSMLTWKARLEERGVPTEGPLRLGPPGQASLYFNDPFGNHLEITCLGYTQEIPVRPPRLTNLAWTDARSLGS